MAEKEYRGEAPTQPRKLNLPKESAARNPWVQWLTPSDLRSLRLRLSKIGSQVPQR